MRVFVSGGSGFVGTNVVEAMVGRGLHVSALVHSSPLSVENDLIETTKGGLFDDAALATAMNGCDAAVHLVGVIEERPDKNVTFERMHVEATRRVLRAAESAGAGRYVHMSALGSRPDAVSAYHQTKWAAEELVRASDLRWTIFRPSLIHGPRGAFMRQAAAWARREALPYLFMPYFGGGLFGLGGAGKLQPVYAEDVATAFADALTNDLAIGRTYNLAGPDVLTWPAMYRLIAEAVVGKRRAAVPIPAWYAKLIARTLPAAWLPFNLAQVQMSQEDNAGDTTEFLADFDVTPAGFAAALSRYADAL